MIKLSRNPAAVPYYKLFSYFHKFRIFMQLLDRFFQFLKRRFFAFHNDKKAKRVYKFFEFWNGFFGYFFGLTTECSKLLSDFWRNIGWFWLECAWNLGWKSLEDEMGKPRRWEWK